MNRDDNALTFTSKQLTGETDEHIANHPLGRVHIALIEPLTKLQKAANQAGFDLSIASAFRSFEQQQQIWDQKWNGERTVFDETGQYELDINQLTSDEKIEAILKWSALPGASRHHWGTELDLYAKNLQADHPIKLEPEVYESNNHEIGRQKPFYLWMLNHLHEFDFFHPYLKDQGGVSREPWHVSYKPLSQIAFKAHNLQLLKQTIKTKNILGASIVIQKLDQIYQRYVINICE